MMKRWIATLAACVVLAACGLVHGTWTERWKKATGPAEAAARMETLPMALGNWQGSVIEVKPDTAGEVAGNLQRRYVNRQTGQAITIALICGRPGPVSIHTPEACYGAAGFSIAPKQKASFQESAASLWKADATRIKVTEESRLRLFWGWNAGQGWTAADDTRLQFARFPVLYKLYVIRELNSLGEPKNSPEPCEEFLQVLLPALEKTLFNQGPAEPGAT